MAGVFDLFSDDPGQAANMMLAAGLLSGRGSFGQILGNSLAQAQGAYSQTQKDRLQTQQAKLQMEELARRDRQAKKQEEGEESMRQALMATGSPQMRAAQSALSMGGGPTIENAQAIPSVDPMQQLMWKALESRQISPMQWLQAQQKEDATTVVAPGATVLKGGKPVFTAPDKKEATPEKWRLYMLSGAQERGIGFDEWNRANLRSGASNVSYGAPVSGVDENGNPIFFQPAKGGGKPAIIPGVKPNPKENVTQDERQAAGALARLESSMKTLEGMAQKNPKALEPGLPQEAVRSVTEIGANLMTTADRQKVEAAQLDALDAALWLATGAAYNKEQLKALSKAYFPQVGDKPTVKEEKRQKLQVVIDAAKARSGRATLPQNQPKDTSNDPLGLR